METRGKVMRAARDNEAEVARVGVVVVTWNSADALTSCLRSVADQDGVNTTLLVVDNASADESAVVARQNGAHVIVNPRNEGFAKAANLGASKLDDPYLLLLNPDAKLADRTCLKRAVAVLQAKERVGSLGPLFITDEGDVQPSAFAPPSLLRELVVASYLYRLIPQPLRGSFLLGPHWPHAESKEVGWLLGAFLLIKRDVWDSLGGMTEDFHMFAEDMEWGIRSQRNGWESLFEPSCVVYHSSNRSAAIRWGVGRSEVSFSSYYDYLRSRHGVTRELVSIIVNGLGFLLRRLVYGVRSAFRHDERAKAWRDEYLRLSAFHVRRFRASLGRGYGLAKHERQQNG